MVKLDLLEIRDLRCGAVVEYVHHFTHHLGRVHVAELYTVASQGVCRVCIVADWLKVKRRCGVVMF